MLKFNLRKLLLQCASVRDVKPSIIIKELTQRLGCYSSKISRISNTPINGTYQISHVDVEIIEAYFRQYLPEAELIINEPKITSHYKPLIMSDFNPLII
jgi:hypothetical protein